MPALAAAGLGFFVTTLDALVVNVAPPSIQDDLGGGVTGLQRVMDGYTLMFAALPLFTRIARSPRRGRGHGRTAVLLDNVPAERAGTASGVLNTFRQLGGALAVAVYGALITTDFLHGMRVGLTISTVLLLVVAAAALTLKRPAEVTTPSDHTHEGGQAMTTSHGPGADWFRGTRARRERRFEADGVEKDVTLTDADGEIDSEVDAAYRTKYVRCSANTIARISSPVAGSATMRLVPRGGADAQSDFGSRPAADDPITFTPHWRTGAYRPRIRRHVGDRTARADHRRAP
ncbi:DUF2255 family protein [Streptomyces olivochromogenes]|uniref:MFS transporter n=1 Tax=Streptomyces olivochromogenes TaxID=1963 RepID=A0A250VLQ4_STROL|nr:DUF2255 family protein [Streptomyces olivochromogenes]KUN44032.1 hypothetical protein AQJ27_28450 [Streptomyces olivochromogenes]GAX54992.1 hypothetical protein SO3561_06546 [Streptomyces olivochromogenes]